MWHHHLVFELMWEHSLRFWEWLTWCTQYSADDLPRCKSRSIAASTAGRSSLNNLGLEWDQPVLKWVCWPLPHDIAKTTENKFRSHIYLVVRWRYGSVLANRLIGAYFHRLHIRWDTCEEIIRGDVFYFFYIYSYLYNSVLFLFYYEIKF